MLRSCQKGSLIIALLITMLLVVIGGVIAETFWSKTPLAVSMLKRALTLNYVEAGLYEAINMFRAGTLDPTTPSTTTITVEGYNVTINVGTSGKVSATVDADTINLH